MTDVDNYGNWRKKNASLKHRKHGCSWSKIHSNWQYIQFQQSSTEVVTPPFLWNDIYYQAKLQRGVCTVFFCILWYKICQFIAVSDLNCEVGAQRHLGGTDGSGLSKSCGTITFKVRLLTLQGLVMTQSHQALFRERVPSLLSSSFPGTHHRDELRPSHNSFLLMAFLSKGGGTSAAFSFLEIPSAAELKLLLPGFHSQGSPIHQWMFTPERIFHWTQCSIKIFVLPVYKTTGNTVFKPLQHKSFKMWVTATLGNWENYWMLLQ